VNKPVNNPLSFLRFRGFNAFTIKVPEALSPRQQPIAKPSETGTCPHMGWAIARRLCALAVTKRYALNPLLSLWENKNKSQIFNCRYSEHLSVYFLTEWLKPGFLVKVLCSKGYGLFFAKSDKRGLSS